MARLDAADLLSGSLADLSDSQAWRDYVLDASYRGVDFLVSSDDMSGGRRGTTHASPYDDTPENEDLGHKAREYRVNAYVIGDDWQRQRDQLIAVIEQGGIGELIHPHYGIQQVWARDYSVRHSTGKMRMVVFDILFVQEDRTRLHGHYPVLAANVPAQAYQQDQAHEQAALTDADTTLGVWL